MAIPKEKILVLLIEISVVYNFLKAKDDIRFREKKDDVIIMTKKSR